LQGIKKGIMEMADTIAITKADGDNLAVAQQARAEYQHALHLFQPNNSGWTPRVIITSALTGEGVENVWQTVDEYHRHAKTSGFLDLQRRLQNVAWFREYFKDALQADLQRHPALKTLRETLEGDVESIELSSQDAAQKLLEAYHQAIRKS